MGGGGLVIVECLNPVSRSGEVGVGGGHDWVATVALLCGLQCEKVLLCSPPHSVPLTNSKRCWGPILLRVLIGERHNTGVSRHNSWPWCRGYTPL